MSKLLTIAIPTYNRQNYLDLCLSQIAKQFNGCEQLVELIVSDNASNDATAEVVKKYNSALLPIVYIKNSVNIGAENNVLQVYQMAESKYVLILADDDLIVDGALSRILHILQTGDYGVVYLNSYPYRKDFERELPRRGYSNALVYSNHKQFVKKVNYFFTFLSGNIINKTLVEEKLIVERFRKTQLVHLSWTFSALFNAQKNMFVEQWMIAVKSDNTGGYDICSVFGVNINIIFREFMVRGIDKKYFQIINRRLLYSFFPNYMRSLRIKDAGFDRQNAFNTLYPIMSRYINFWLFTAPAIYLPLPLVRVLLSFVREGSKVIKRIDHCRTMLWGNKLEP